VQITILYSVVLLTVFNQLEMLCGHNESGLQWADCSLCCDFYWFL